MKRYHLLIIISLFIASCYVGATHAGMPAYEEYRITSNNVPYTVTYPAESVDTETSLCYALSVLSGNRTTIWQYAVNSANHHGKRVLMPSLPHADLELADYAYTTMQCDLKLYTTIKNNTAAAIEGWLK